MDLPINDRELDLIISALDRLNWGNETEKLHNKLKLVKEVRQYGGSWPAPYKKILREKYGMVI